MDEARAVDDVVADPSTGRCRSDYGRGSAVRLFPSVRSQASFWNSYRPLIHWWKYRPCDAAPIRPPYTFAGTFSY